MADWVIVVGGGLAGHSAAHTVLQAGGKVVLLDKSAFCGGNSTKATSGINGAGTKTQKKLNIPDTPDIFEADTTKSAGQSARPRLIHALTHGSAPAVEWLQEAFDLQLNLVGQLGAHSYPRTHRGKERFPGMMITYRLMERFEDACKHQPDRARLVTKARAERLLTDDAGRVIGVEYEKKGKTYTEHGAVILATGGFGADFTNNSLLRQVEEQWRALPMWRDIPNLPALTSFPTTNGSHTTGDGIKMAMAVGATTTDLPYVQVHPTGLVDPKKPDAKVKWLAAEALRGSGAILIDARGNRFCNELGKRDYVTGRMLRCQAPFRLVMNGKQSREFEWCVSRCCCQAPSRLCRHFHVNTHTITQPANNDNTAHEPTICCIAIPPSSRAHHDFFLLPSPSTACSLLDCVVYGRLAGSTAAAFTRSAGTATVAAAPSSSTSSSQATSSTSTSSSSSSSSSSSLPAYTMAEVAKHNTEDDCWVVIHGKVYDVTDFLEDHPGGAASIVAYAGKDATKPFDMLHSLDLLTKYADDYIVGVLAGDAAGDDISTTTTGADGSSNGNDGGDGKAEGVISLAEVAKHNKEDDCWIVVHGKVYDVTTFLKDHPAGPAIIMKYAGKDGTAAFDASGHPKDIVSQLGLDHLCLGDAEGGDQASAPVAVSTERADTQIEGKPPLSQVLNLFEFEAVARKCMSQQGWVYYSSGSDDEMSLRENHSAFHRLWLRPRILIDVSSVDLGSTMLGHRVKMPVYITSCALGRLAHPDGELCLTRAAATRGVVQLWPTLASCTIDEMASAATNDQILFLQLYVNHDRSVSERLIRRAEKRGIKAIFVTVDAPQLGRREKDMRVKFTMEAPTVQKSDDSAGNVDRNQGTARAISQFIDPSLSWKDIEWLRGVTKLPIVLKGVQCAEDALLAAERGLDGIVCSNHGGRQLDFARSGIEVLVEVMAALRARGWQNKMEVYVDGGVRRGTDVLKALALGAKAVGIGRPTLYAMAGYGTAGVERVFEIVEDEMIMGMRLMGAQRIADLKPSMVCTKSLAQHIAPAPKDSLSEYVYEPLNTMSKL
ncbi:cytochrome b2 [Salpingoeca rosetta]|uniref:L-lactate dehydrogenase (cytochrome) n=1 Tax=Salpingoeca rosetta (strain ATCC 50818 / BSB-021) TaxID=946362 RepID=F2TXQ8_SALR5|nr:cytochrome b2 [Salpingoeca rosetta]EGD76167.1 cytochrome b2 [Salpingoeca rosetta]|eukprot:XP_004998342.1 cytochrome b2 [Salpingoeca rosetta]